MSVILHCVMCTHVWMRLTWEYSFYLALLHSFNEPSQFLVFCSALKRQMLSVFYKNLVGCYVYFDDLESLSGQTFHKEDWNFEWSSQVLFWNMPEQCKNYLEIYALTLALLFSVLITGCLSCCQLIWISRSNTKSIADVGQLLFHSFQPSHNLS